MERALRRCTRQRILRAGWQTDLKHFFVSHAGVQLLSFATHDPGADGFAWAVQLDFQQAVAAQPLWLQFIEILLVVDLATYWVHRAFHQVPWLWSFHAIHHSSLHLDWLAGSRMHVVDVLVTRSAAFLPVFVLGFAPAALYAYLVFVSFHAVFIHANVRWRFPSALGDRHAASSTTGTTLRTKRASTRTSPASCRCGTSSSAPRTSPTTGRSATARTSSSRPRPTSASSPIRSGEKARRRLTADPLAVATPVGVRAPRGADCSRSASSFFQNLAWPVVPWPAVSGLAGISSTRPFFTRLISRSSTPARAGCARRRRS